MAEIAMKEAGISASSSTIQELQDRIKRLEEENFRLRSSMTNGSSGSNHQQSIESRKAEAKSVASSSLVQNVDSVEDEKSSMNEDEVSNGLPKNSKSTTKSSLTREQVERYSRQLLLSDGYGVQGQLKLLSSSVLIVGAGGIGSTVILYLAACGVGKLTIVDFDSVEISNLHRQVIHKTSNVGLNKAQSACQAVRELNPSITCQALTTSLNYDNAMQIISQHDCVVDASDNPQTRYLINDACVLASKTMDKNIPLVSGSAMGTEGQLSVYNYKTGPCYRCLYPQPNATEGCKSCADNGVLGPVPGLIGILQALETVKVLTDTGVTMHDRLVMYDSLRCSFYNIKKPPKQPKCPVCCVDSNDAGNHGGEGQIHLKIRSMRDSYKVSQAARGPTSCPLKPTDQSNKTEENNETTDGNTESDAPSPPYSLPPIPDFLSISCSEYRNQIQETGKDHLLLDVRSKEQFELCHIVGAVNIPLANLPTELQRVKELSNNGNKPIYCICRRGIFSTTATLMLHETMCADSNKSNIDDNSSNNRLLAQSVYNITGGLQSWRNEVDSMFPKY